MKKGYDIIIISGAPGSGKTTISNILKNKLNEPPMIDFGWIREFHLDTNWKKANKREEQMSFENLVFILKNYIKNKYKNIIINDLLDDKVLKLAKIFPNSVVITLTINNQELEKRVLSPRDSGFKNVNKAIEYNSNILKRKKLKNEFRIDNSHNSPNKTVEEILKIIK